MWVEDGLRPQLESIDESGVPFALGCIAPNSHRDFQATYSASKRNPGPPSFSAT